MVATGIGKAPANSATLPFYGAGAVFFLALSILMFFAADRFQDHFFTPETLALVHSAALGWGTMIIFGAAYQLLPVIFERDLFSSRMAFISFWFLLIGTIVLIASFWYFETGFAMIAGGALILIAVILYNLNVFLTGASSKFSVQKLYLLSSAIWLLITVIIGLLLAINLYYPYIPYNHLEILKLHAHIGFIGWFLQLIVGVSSKLVPMFLFGKSERNQLLYVAFVFQNLGLAGYVCDQFFYGNSSRVYIYFILVALGILSWLAYLADVYKSRVKKKIDFQMKYTSISIISLLVALILVPAVLMSSGNQWSILYGIFIFLGWISALIFGKTFKTLPFVVWNMHYKDMHGKNKIPLPRNLYSERLLIFQFWFFISALVVLSVGVRCDLLVVIRAGLLLWILVASTYVFNVAKVFLHKKII